MVNKVNDNLYILIQSFAWEATLSLLQRKDFILDPRAAQGAFFSCELAHSGHLKRASHEERKQCSSHHVASSCCHQEMVFFFFQFSGGKGAF